MTPTGSPRAAARPARASRAVPLGEGAVIAVLRLANRITLELAARLKPHGLTPSQYNALRILRGAGEAGVTCGQMSERMITRDPDITRLLDRLERAGWVERRRDSADRRVVTTRITPAGGALLGGLDAAVRRFDRAVFAALDDDALGRFVALASAVLEG